VPADDYTARETLNVAGGVPRFNGDISQDSEAIFRTRARLSLSERWHSARQKNQQAAGNGAACSGFASGGLGVTRS